MVYTLANTHRKLNQLTDKMGSDYFPMPLFLNFFETATYDFLGERLKHVEKTQEITDDIRPLIIPRDVVVSTDPNNAGKVVVPVPANYLRLLAYDVYYADGSKCRRADLVRHGEAIVNAINPNSKPTKQYPAITQYESYLEINAGTDTANISKAHLVYCKKPSFAEIGVNNNDNILVDLPDDAIEKILKKTVLNLFNKTADERTQSSFQLDQAFRTIMQ